jgi:hypothetical protein
MRVGTLALVSVLITTASLGCLVVTPEDCPITTVTLDAGTETDALPAVGDYGTCELFCPANMSVCHRVGKLVLTCQPGCA